MKNAIFIALLCFVMAGCGGSASEESLASPTQAQAEVAEVELTDEEVMILENVQEMAEEAEEVTRENYEDALKKLEEETEAEEK